jgi:UDP-2,3-diacylglucosamine hydrolase
VEALEGTDETILRAGRWAGKGTIAVKVASSRQDWRFDVPAVGTKTIRSLAKAGAAGIVLEAGRSFLVHQEESLCWADKNGIFILAV